MTWLTLPLIATRLSRREAPPRERIHAPESSTAMATTVSSSDIPRHNRAHAAEFFDPQPTPRAELPDPTATIEKLALIGCEIIAGLRSVDQIGRWVTEDVYRVLAERAIAARRNRAATSAPARPLITVGLTVVTEPRDGIVEGVSLVRIGRRTRAMCIRLEGLDHRWRASALALL